VAGVTPVMLPGRRQSGDAAALLSLESYSRSVPRASHAGGRRRLGRGPGSEWGCWLSLTAGLHSTDSGSVRILEQVGPALSALQQDLM